MIGLMKDFHAEYLSVERDGDGRVLNSQHCLRKVKPLPVTTLVSSLDNLNPVAIRIVRKCQPFHPTLIGLLLKRDSFSFEFRTRSIHILDVECEMTKPITLSVSWMVLRRIQLRAIIVHELDRRASMVPFVLVCFDTPWQQFVVFFGWERRQSVHRKLHVWEVERVNQRHPKVSCIEREALLGVLDADYRLPPGWAKCRHFLPC
mmetsp:Transcript_19264/g.27109  ORF Transcript_19264/g.27109 Transcript_19264/m.27109 type:complete len:204 (+) Transcript_19264:391-1002(+)